MRFLSRFVKYLMILSPFGWSVIISVVLWLIITAIAIIAV